MQRISNRLCGHAGRALGGLGLLFGLSSGHSAEFKFPNHTLTVPDGFEVELVAGPPLVDRPIMVDFDEEGRLYVADSAGINDPVDRQLKTRPHRILRLEDTDGDGRFDRRTVFADRMMFPEGVLWFDGAVYCGAPPSIWKLEDTDGDGVADRRTEWFKGLTLTGCANDIHGPYEGLDGWLYWCKGAFAKQPHERSGRPTISDSAAHIFRCRPDGGDFDSVMSGGMDNPVEVAFTPEGETIFTTTFYCNPEGGKRDALVHAVYGGVYPKVHGVLDGLTRTGDLLPPLTHLGPAAACALMRYSSTALGPEFEGNLFSSLFNLRKVQRHILRREGSTFATTDSDFLVSDNPDFHPTDVQEDADGSLLVVDTGGWYKICCPTSQLAKPEVLGAIYRVRRTGTRAPADPRGLRLDWPGMTPAELASLLGDQRPAVRRRAIARLAKQGASAVPSLAGVIRDSRSVQARQNAVWALTRIEASEARAAVRVALLDKDIGVRQAATHSVGLLRDTAAGASLVEELGSSSLHLQRNAATALGRLGDKSAVVPLLATAATPHDRFLEHSLIYALIEIGDASGTAAGLGAASPFTRRAALIALDQMPGSNLAASTVIPYLSSTHGTLKETAFWIVSQHPQWGGELSGLYATWLRDKTLRAEQTQELGKQLTHFVREPAIQQVIADALADSSVADSVKLALLDAMARGSVETLPAAWARELESTLHISDAELLRHALAALRTLPIARPSSPARSDSSANPAAPESHDFAPSLLEVARNAALPEDVRLQAVAALPGGIEQPAPALLEFLCGALDPSKPPLDRGAAAAALGRAKLNEAQLLILAHSLKSAGPMELTKLLGAFDVMTNEVVGLAFVNGLKTSPALASLRAEVLKPLLAKFPESVQAQAADLLAALSQDLAGQQKHLDELQTGLKNGDRDRGRRIFESTTTACSTCHQVGYVGGHVGPDLTKIGAIRTERDLLEAVVYPSASFVRSYEPVMVTTKDGEEYAGVSQQASADSMVIVSGPGAEHRIVMKDVVEIRPGSVSVMPDGLVQALAPPQLSDLIAFLKSLK